MNIELLYEEKQNLIELIKLIEFRLKEEKDNFKETGSRSNEAASWRSFKLNELVELRKELACVNRLVREKEEGLARQFFNECKYD